MNYKSLKSILFLFVVANLLLIKIAIAQSQYQNNDAYNSLAETKPTNSHGLGLRGNYERKSDYERKKQEINPVPPSGNYYNDIQNPFPRPNSDDMNNNPRKPVYDKTH